MNKRQRGRNRNNNRNRQPNNNPNRSMDSNGPDVKVRGSASTIYEKYITLARDARSAGSRVKAENYLQHAEHYLRIVQEQQIKAQAHAEEQARKQEARQQEMRKQKERQEEKAAQAKAAENTNGKDEVQGEVVGDNRETVDDANENKPVKTKPRSRRKKAEKPEAEKTDAEKTDTEKSGAEKAPEVVAEEAPAA